MIRLTWSPDGRWISYDKVAFDDYLNPSLHLVHADGSDAHTVIQTDDGRAIDVPDTAIWSPDGHQFSTGTSQESPDDPGFVLVDPDSGTLTEMPGLGVPIGWSPDGKEYGFFADRTLSLRDTAGATRTFQSRLRHIDAAAWSSTGELAVAATSGATTDIECIDMVRGQPEVITHLPQGSIVGDFNWRPQPHAR